MRLISDAHRMYDEGYSCSCHTMPPCSFCTSLTEEEADILWNDGIDGLTKYWKRNRSIEK